MGHARALLSLDDPKTQIRIFNEIQSQGYSVRKVEEIVKEMCIRDSHYTISQFSYQNARFDFDAAKIRFFI